MLKDAVIPKDQIAIGLACTFCGKSVHTGETHECEEKKNERQVEGTQESPKGTSD